MTHTVRQLPSTGASAVAGEQTVTLQVVDGNIPANWPGERPPAANGQMLRLFSLVTLQRPRIRSTADRRKRLSHSLADGDASRNAGILARDPHFWDFLQQINLMAYEGEIDTRRARHFINRACGVNGRYDFEHCPDAALCYFSLIEEPFLDWLLAEDGD